MKSVFGLALLALATSGAYAQNIEIVSPKHVYTFAYGDAISHQIERDRLTNEMIARVTFSNYPYAGDCEARRDEMFDFVFPGLQFDATLNEFFARTRHHARIPIAALHPNFPYAGYKLEPTAKIFLVKRSGHVTVGAECDGAATRWGTLGAARRQLVVAEFARARAREIDALASPCHRRVRLKRFAHEINETYKIIPDWEGRLPSRPTVSVLFVCFVGSESNPAMAGTGGNNKTCLAT